MTLFELFITANVAVLVGLRLVLFARGGVKPGSKALSHAQHVDQYRAEVAQAVRGRRTRLMRAGESVAIPGITVTRHSVPVHIAVQSLSFEELSLGLDEPGDAAPSDLPLARRTDMRAQIIVRVSLTGLPAALIWSRTRDPRSPNEDEQCQPRVELADSAFDMWVGVCCTEPARARAALSRHDVQDLMRRLMLANVPFGARLTMDATGLEWCSLVTDHTTPEWVGRAIPALIRVAQSFANARAVVRSPERDEALAL